MIKNNIIALFILLVFNSGCKKDNPTKLTINEDQKEYLVRVGERIVLSPEVSSNNKELNYKWTINGHEVGSEKSFAFSPGKKDLGLTEIELTLSGAGTVKETLTYNVYALNTNKYKKIGYWPIYHANAQLPSDGQLKKLTHLVCSFLTVSADGSITNDALLRLLPGVIQKAHSHGVYVMVAIGGGGNHPFGDCIMNETSRNKLIANVLSVAKTYHIDGVDIDFEAWEGGTASLTDPLKKEGLLVLLKEIRAGLNENQILAMPVGTSEYYMHNYTVEMYQYLDWVGLMLYDYRGTWPESPYGQHSSLDDFKRYITIWKNEKSLPNNKLVAGIPFYGYKFAKEGVGGLAEGIAYKDIIGQESNAYSTDNVGTIFYNGQATISQKAQYVKENDLQGVLIWEIMHDLDAANEKSLLKSVNDILID